MEPKEEKPTKEGTTVSPATEEPGTSRDGAEETKGPAMKMDSEDGGPVRPQGEAGGLEEEEQGEPQKEAGGKEETQAEPRKEDGGKEDATAASLETTERKDETKAEPRETEEKEEALPASQKQTDEKEAPAEPEEKDREEGKDKPTPTEAGRDEATNQEAEAEPQKVAVHGEPQEADGEEEAGRGAEELEPTSPGQEQEQDADKEPEEGAAGIPSSPEEWPESPSEEGRSLSPDGGGGLASEASGETSPPASDSSPGDAPQGPTESPPAGEKQQRLAPERRASASARPQGPRTQNRRAIVDRFGGAASGPTALFRNTKAAGAAVGGVKSMLLEWCRAMTRKYEHVDIQNFSSSWSSGLAFCALIHRFFPDAFDYAALDPTKRRHNFTLAFSTAEKLADCAQLLDVDDMVRLAVPDSKCVYTYIQELYRSLVQKGLVKTKKK